LALAAVAVRGDEVGHTTRSGVSAHLIS